MRGVRPRPRAAVPHTAALPRERLGGSNASGRIVTDAIAGLLGPAPVACAERPVLPGVLGSLRAGERGSSRLNVVALAPAPGGLSPRLQDKMQAPGISSRNALWVSLAFCLSIVLWIRLTVCISIAVDLSLALWISLPIYISIAVCISIARSLRIALCISIAIWVTLVFCLSIAVYISTALWVRVAI